jgi:hypothetical protein
LAVLPHVSLRIIPLSGGVHLALGASFALLSFEHARASISHVDSLANADYIKNPTTYTLAFEHEGRMALSEDKSNMMPMWTPASALTGATEVELSGLRWW